MLLICLHSLLKLRHLCPPGEQRSNHLDNNRLDGEEYVDYISFMDYVNSRNNQE
jgi:hypothetical protein